MTSALSGSHNRLKTFSLLAFCGLAALAAAVIGIDDNLPGILLAFLAAITLVLSLVQGWRTVRQFRSLLLMSILGLVILVILNNLFAAIAHGPAAMGTFKSLMQALAVAAFLLGTLICPAGIVVGAAGMAVMYIRERRSN